VAVPRWGGGTDLQIVAMPPNLAVLLTRCDQLILRKISKFVVTRYKILRLKGTKFDFRWGFAADSARGVCSAPPDPQLYLRGLLLRRERGKRGRETGDDGEVRGGERRGGESHPQKYFGLEPPRAFALRLVFFGGTTLQLQLGLIRGKSGPALGGTEYRLMPSACRLIVRAKL